MTEALGVVLMLEMDRCSHASPSYGMDRPLGQLSQL